MEAGREVEKKELNLDEILTVIDSCHGRGCFVFYGFFFIHHTTPST